MISKLRGRVSSAHVIALVALFVALGGTAFAAAKIGTNDIQNKAVTKPKIDKQAVSTNRIADLAVKTKKLADEAVTVDKLGSQSVTTDKLADLAVTTPKIADQAVGTDKLADSSVNSAKIQDAQVRAAELGPTQLATSTVNVAANGNGVAATTCPAGTTVISGGGTASSFAVHMVTSFRAGNGWIVAYQNTTATQRTITAIATCLSA